MEVSKNNDSKNGKSIILGILTQETTGIRNKHPEVTFQCFVSSAYVEFAKATGAAVIPILIGKDKNYYIDIMEKVNGVLFPGGATFFDKPNETNDYANASRYILKIAIDMNNNGIYLPIFGICLGMHVLIWLSEGIDRRECEKTFRMDKLYFTEDFRNSKMFSDASEDEVKMFTENVCEFHHRWCYTQDNLKLNTDWRIISYREEITSDIKNKLIITALESIKYPFYGLQFHPEKPEFEPKSKCPSEQKELAQKANRYFVNFIKKELEKNVSNRNIYLDKSILISDINLCETSQWLSSSSKCYMY